jgi:hypothetical protein
MALAVCLLILPAAGLEVINSSANLHWYLLFVGSWVVLWRPITRRDILTGCVVLFLGAASDPFAVLLAPVVLWNTVRERRSSDVSFTLALFAGLTLQALVIYFSESQRSLDPFSTPVTTVLSWYGSHVLITSVLGVGIRDALLSILGTAPTAALALVVLSALLVPAMRRAKSRPFVPLVLIGLHLGFYFLPVTLAATSTPRYSVIPIMLLYSLIAWGVAGSTRPMVHRAAAVTILAFLIVADFARWNQRAEGPAWEAGLSTARSICETGATAATIAIPPRTAAADATDSTTTTWSVRVPCNRLEGSLGQ